MDANNVDYHLTQAFAHLKQALNISVDMVQLKQIKKEELGKKWELFFSEFFGMVKRKGVENKLNLLSWISFSNFRKW
ncbi:hypothetical protein [Aneurinibacillus terranovensis]|uniref:hypothetical protein n=1 Tax=Aneurinibacillus terranovensis TaxID=278991 RepID=UPI00041FA10E|nr:hypothetical protein [Aneurinibacillus terranovensis]